MKNKKFKKTIKLILLFIVAIVLFFILNPSEEDYLIKDVNKKSSMYLEECKNVNDNYLIFVDDIEKIEARKNNIIIDNKNLIKGLIEKERLVPQSLENIEKINIETGVNNK